MTYFLKRNFIGFILCFVLIFSTTAFANDMYAPSTPEERVNLSSKVEFTIEIPIQEGATRGTTIIPVKCTAQFVKKSLILVTVLNESPTIPLEDVELTLWTWDQYGIETSSGLDHKSLGPLGCLLSFGQPVQVSSDTFEALVRIDVIAANGATGSCSERIKR